MLASRCVSAINVSLVAGEELHRADMVFRVSQILLSSISFTISDVR